MTKLLEEAFTLARQLPTDRQDELAARIIAEITDGDDFDRSIAATAHKLDWLIDEALEEDRAGLTEEWQPLRSLTLRPPGSPARSCAP